MSLKTSASRLTAYTILSDTPAAQSCELPTYRPQLQIMDRDTPAALNTEIPPASYYDPYPAFKHEDAPLLRLEPDSTNPRVALQQNDKSGESAIPVALLGRYQAPVSCPACSRRTITAIRHKNGRGTHTWAGILFFTTGLGAFVPYVCDYFKDVQHRCGRCGILLATSHFSSGTEGHVH